ncbi:hypothetical protein HanRHA438_Chr11g0513011 [Helianthus annuus]|uniref:Uncharacterized protein n=1 Tax=Helianthus annuus TaxID=4232 RepID=A0A9K3HR73_HELAN|nr:hypothetical protein HanXRQr2_Chr11g0500241 [Helianthus annuus]KAJ0502245.1 hypothetical protein HanHA300_Chr11g0410601 [Helianthus annuus]KAJ0510248.1 hypothetical protein HanIR_Chr11g0538561 [Helianthus annuus]KAJ0686198.1 hypothetical protein HanLR1_Chr11g0411921 [Helianthus annuus]KAJ0871495.1 hypothetical protein HanRHA438_Chr11g0513011 [Helianthus annuus]
MGAAWLALSESTKPTLKLSSSESLKALSDTSSIILSQVKKIAVLHLGMLKRLMKSAKSNRKRLKPGFLDLTKGSPDNSISYKRVKTNCSKQCQASMLCRNATSSTCFSLLTCMGCVAIQVRSLLGFLVSLHVTFPGSALGFSFSL